MKSVFLLLSLTSYTQAASILFEPSPYLSAADSPFYNGILNGDVYLEDFEDQALNTPFVRQVTNVNFFGRTIRADFPSVPDGFVRSVDADDGIIDFSGFLGDSWITSNIGSNTGSNRAGFEFLPDENGQYPTFVGVVITAVDDVDRQIDFIFRDLDGNDLFADSEFDPKLWNTGLFLNGDPRTHRFVGVFNEDGISSLSISNVWQLDHLQYGVIPEPSTTILLSLTSLSLLSRRKRST